MPIFRVNMVITVNEVLFNYSPAEPGYVKNVCKHLLNSVDPDQLASEDAN